MTRAEDRKIQVDLDCGLNIFNLLAGGKWKACILKYVDSGVKRPNELHKAMPYAAPRVLNMQLRELHEHKLISKTIYPGLPLHVVYDITPLGKSMLPVIDAMEAWGDKHKETVLKSLTATPVTTDPVCDLKIAG